MILLLILYLAVLATVSLLLITLWVQNIIYFRTVVITLVILLAGLIMLSIYFSQQYVDSLPEIKVPNIVGLTREQGSAKLKKLGLNFQVIREVFHSAVPAGRIVLQQPKRQRIVKTGETVKLVLSKGARLVTVPNLIGKNLAQARVLLRENGIVLKKIEEVIAEDKIPGTILTQSLTAESLVRLGVLMYVTAAGGVSIEGESRIR